MNESSVSCVGVTINFNSHTFALLIEYQHGGHVRGHVGRAQ